MRTPVRGGSLAQHHLRWLAALAAAVAAMILISVLALVLLPTAQRSASDLAGLMVLSAQTWVELPPETRPALAAATGFGPRSRWRANPSAWALRASV